MGREALPKPRAPDEAPVKPARKPAGGRSEERLYIQLSRTLRDEIIGGIFPVGAQLPTEDELCERFSVSRFTVREALRRLREAGLVVSRQGAGTVVIPPAPPDPYVLHATSINDLVAFGTGTKLSIDSLRTATIGGDLAAQLGVPAGGDWLAVRGFRHAEGVKAPVCRAEYYIHRDYAAVGRILQRHAGPIFSLIEDMFAVSIAEVTQDIAAVRVPSALAAGLQVKSGTVALEVRRTYRLAEGKIAQITVNTHPATRFRHSMTLRRVKG